MVDVGDRDTAVDLGFDVTVAQEPFPGVVAVDAFEPEIGEFAMLARRSSE
ncbi:hypothetical protein [Nocardia beijingensis]